MNISMVEVEIPMIENVDVTQDNLIVELSDGRSISVPLAWFPRLLHASVAERKKWRLIGKGHGIHWEDIDEDISVENLITGTQSGESQKSFKKWIESRKCRPTRRSSGRAMVSGLAPCNHFLRPRPRSHGGRR